ncbi:MAG: hypothetical protein ACR5K4_01875 [Sodalis sp. (in: enterobacteria)]
MENGITFDQVVTRDSFTSEEVNPASMAESQLTFFAASKTKRLYDVATGLGVRETVNS